MVKKHHVPYSEHFKKSIVCTTEFLLGDQSSRLSPRVWLNHSLYERQLQIFLSQVQKFGLMHKEDYSIISIANGHHRAKNEETKSVYIPPS